MATLWRSLTHAVRAVRARWTRRRAKSEPQFPYSYRQHSIPQQLVRNAEEKP